eukprot:6149646-Alexandrium_andersonii.AAC.1
MVFAVPEHGIQESAFLASPRAPETFVSQVIRGIVGRSRRNRAPRQYAAASRRHSGSAVRGGP